MRSDDSPKQDMSKTSEKDARAGAGGRGSGGGKRARETGEARGDALLYHDQSKHERDWAEFKIRFRRKLDLRSTTQSHTA